MCKLMLLTNYTVSTRSKSLWRWYIGTNIMCLDIINHPVPSSIDKAQMNRFYLKTETESSLRNVVFWKVNRTVFLYKDKTTDNIQKHCLFWRKNRFCIIILYSVKLMWRLLSFHYIKLNNRILKTDGDSTSVKIIELTSETEINRQMMPLPPFVK
jgi:hypothetical protein